MGEPGWALAPLPLSACRQLKKGKGTLFLNAPFQKGGLRGFVNRHILVVTVHSDTIQWSNYRNQGVNSWHFEKK